jgi:hypothetical protein
LGVILFGALEAEAAFGHVLAGDDVFAAIGMTDASGVADFDARVFAAIDAREGGVIGSGRRHGENGGPTFGLLKPERAAPFGRQGKQRKRGKQWIPTGIGGLAQNCRTERRKKAGRRAILAEEWEEELAGREWNFTEARRRQRKAAVARLRAKRIAD